MSTYDDNEHNLALRHTAVFKPGDLVVCDRNYASFWMFALLKSKNVDFCFRLKVGSWKTAGYLVENQEQETTTKIYPSKQSAKKCKELGVSNAPVRLRFICITLNTGEKEVLVTSLTDGQYPYGIFSQLYRLRWQVEESYKTMKSRLEMENLAFQNQCQYITSCCSSHYYKHTIHFLKRQKRILGLSRLKPEVTKEHRP